LTTTPLPQASPAETDLVALKAEIINRLHAAALTIQALPGDGPKGPYTLWPAYRHTWWDEGNEASKLSAADITRRLIEAPRFYPTPKQIDDCLPTLALLDGGEPIWRRIVSARAHQLWYDEPGGWRGIAAACNVNNPVKALRLYSRAISYALKTHLELPPEIAPNALSANAKHAGL
jgi:hypothetical protein